MGITACRLILMSACGGWEKSRVRGECPKMFSFSECFGMMESREKAKIPSKADSQPTKCHLMPSRCRRLNPGTKPTNARRLWPERSKIEVAVQSSARFRAGHILSVRSGQRCDNTDEPAPHLSACTYKINTKKLTLRAFPPIFSVALEQSKRHFNGSKKRLITPDAIRTAILHEYFSQ